MTSNREPAEWLTMTADTLLAQSAIDRLTATAHTLVIEGPSYRQRTRASLTQTTPTSILNNAPRWSHPPGNQVVPSPWQATSGADRRRRSMRVWAIITASSRVIHRIVTPNLRCLRSKVTIKCDHMQRQTH